MTDALVLTFTARQDSKIETNRARPLSVLGYRQKSNESDPRNQIIIVQMNWNAIALLIVTRCRYSQATMLIQA
jgi:hypothetical protein